MRFLVVGAGAVGGFFGALLAKAGRDVTFLVRPARAEQLRRDGLRVKTPSREFTVAPKLIVKSEIAAPFDLVLLSVKAYALDAAMDDFAAAVGAQTMVLPLLNGMRHIDTLAARFGEHAVLGGVTQVSTDLASDGSIVQLTPYQVLVFGERDGSTTKRIREVEMQLSGAGFEAKLSADITGFMWEKWVVLAALASITCLFRSSIGEVAAVPRGLQVENALLDETASIAAAEGHPASAAFLQIARARLTKRGSLLTASMFRDVQRRAPVEVEHVIGDLLARGEASGVQAPLLRAAYVHLAAYQARVAGLGKSAANEPA